MHILQYSLHDKKETVMRHGLPLLINAIKKSLVLTLITSTHFTIAAEQKLESKPLTALEDEIQWLQEETYVSTATKTLESISKSGATVYVITAEDLKKMGARNLMDALKHVPGLGINTINIGIPTVEVRGVKTEYSEKVLFLVNGHSINNNLVNGGATWSHNNFIVDDIKQVEIVTGPGSALYGANAFVAVINIITKKMADIDGTKLTFAAGDNDAKKVNLQTGQTIGDLKFATNLNFFDTNGFREEVESASGHTDDWNKRYDVGFNLSYSNYSLQGKYHKRTAGSYAGFFNALNDESKQDYTEYFFELGYDRTLSNALQLSSNLYYDYFNADNFWELLPEDALPNFPDGLLARSPIEHERIGAELQLEYTYRQHKVLLGIMSEHQSQFGLGFDANFNPTTFDPNTSTELLGGYQDISDRWPWNGSQNRDINAVFIQDIWDMKKNIRLIVGARYDHYSDFGGSFNPRTSFSWEFEKNFNFVATYGSAFRAPNFGELYNINNPSAKGDPDLSPEEIETFELGINGKLNKRTSFRITGFRNNITDLINNVSAVSTNVGELEVKGIEMEMSSRLSDGSSFAINYTYQYAINKLTEQRIADVPMHKANASFNYRHSQYINSYIGLLHRGKVKREMADTRSDLSDHITVDLALNWQNYIKNLEVKASVFNVFDEELVDAAPVGTIVSDFPLPGRNLMIEVSYKL
ncbi:MAG: iron complex outermembrane receptor protein [Oleiphilaceae bacterium]|jgi:iron complex outermembrane receptor protein